MKLFRILNILVLIGGIFSACQQVQSLNENVVDGIEETAFTIDKSEVDNGKITLGTLSKEVFNNWVRAKGMVDVPPSSKASISVYYGGYVKSIDLLPGHEVKKGQKLFNLVNPEFIKMQESFIGASADLKFAREDFERQQKLKDENITSQKNYKQAEAKFQSAKAMYQSLAEQLELININPKNVESGEIRSVVTIYSPIDGFVSKVNVNLGKFLEPKDLAMEIINTDHIHLELKVYEKDIVNIKEGQHILFKIPESSSEQMQGVVHVAGKTVDGSDRTVDIHGHVNTDVYRLVHGMYVEAEINVTGDSLMSLPTTAIIQKSEGDFVAVKKAENPNSFSFELQKVETGRISNNNWVEILNWEQFKNVQVILAR